MRVLGPGIYDLLLTRSEQECVERDRISAAKIESEIDHPDSRAASGYLARHLVEQIKAQLASLSLEEQVDFANELLAFAAQRDGAAYAATLARPPAVLKARYLHPPPPVPPTTPLSSSDLITNAAGAPRLGYELEAEMRNADSVFMIVSFIQWKGFVRLKPAFDDLNRRGCPVEILTTTYIGATDFSALLELSRYPNVSIKISLDGRSRRLHAKSWLFQRDNGFSSMYVGSANLSAPALEDGIEWTVKLSQVEAPHIVDRFQAAFRTRWEDPEFESFDKNDSAFHERVRAALIAAKGNASSATVPTFFDLVPHPYQKKALDELESERLDHNSFRNLVVAPTGTGKTLIAAFDYAREPYVGHRPRLLVLAHREELLHQCRDVFRNVLRDNSFGELLAGGTPPASADHIFATIQSFQSRGIADEYGFDHWQYVVVDEAHHVPAESYAGLIRQLSPGILLGLTATPERMDGESILPWFNGRIAVEMRLWHAIERQYLAPFDYYGIADETDLSDVRWVRGGYAIGDLEKRYTGDLRRAELIVDRFCSCYGATRDARALGFCVSIAHAEYMAAVFNRAGIPSLAVTSQTQRELRQASLTRLRNREINVLFTVDLFNEGIDIPEADCVLFLRPTESATVFLQQLGRGLRLHTGKTSCLVLDFIGNQRREFRFDVRYAALLGGTRRQIADGIEHNAPQLPGNCYFRFDKVSRQIVLDNLRQRLTSNRERMASDARQLAAAIGKRPTLSEFLAEMQLQPEDLYKGRYGCSSVLYDAGLLPSNPGPDEERVSASFDRILHVDSVARLRLYQSLVHGQRHLDTLSEAEQRMVRMLSWRLNRGQPMRWQHAIQDLQASPAIANEFDELSTVLLGRVRLHVDETPKMGDWPLIVHRSYRRDEILIAVGRATESANPQWREGVLWIPEANTELLAVTLDKSSKRYSPTTRYTDYAISPNRFHWQSQSTTGEDSPTGIRYRTQAINGTRVLLFVRPAPEDAYVFLGPVFYESHTSSKPMNIIWRLAEPMPPQFFEPAAALALA